MLMAMLRFNQACTLMFLLLIAPSVTIWKDSVPYLIAISVWANFAGHLSAWQAARVELRQARMEAAPADVTGDET